VGLFGIPPNVGQHTRGTEDHRGPQRRQRTRIREIGPEKAYAALSWPLQLNWRERAVAIVRVLLNPGQAL
jgi:hypothetical protein